MLRGRTRPGAAGSHSDHRVLGKRPIAQGGQRATPMPMRGVVGQAGSRVYDLALPGQDDCEVLPTHHIPAPSSM